MKDHANIVELEDIIMTLEFWLSSDAVTNEVEPRRLYRALNALSEVYAMRIRAEVRQRVGSRTVDLAQSQYDDAWTVLHGDIDHCDMSFMGPYSSVLQAGKVVLDLLDASQ